MGAFPSLPRRRPYFLVCHAAATVAYTAHVAYLSIVLQFDYTYNSRFGSHSLGLAASCSPA